MAVFQSEYSKEMSSTHVALLELLSHVGSLNGTGFTEPKPFMPAQLVVQLPVSLTLASKVLILLSLIEMPSVVPTEVDRVTHGSEAMWLQKPLWRGQGAPRPMAYWGGSC